MTTILPYEILPKAENDLLIMHSYFSLQENKEVFSLLYSRIENAISLICEFPEISQYSEHFNARVFPVQKTHYNIIFEVQNQKIHILRFFHTAQK